MFIVSWTAKCWIFSWMIKCWIIIEKRRGKQVDIYSKKNMVIIINKWTIQHSRRSQRSWYHQKRHRNCPYATLSKKLSLFFLLIAATLKIKPLSWRKFWENWRVLNLQRQIFFLRPWRDFTEFFFWNSRFGGL